MRALIMLLAVCVGFGGPLPLVAAEGDGPFIRAFYPDDRPELVGYLDQRVIPVVVSTPVCPTQPSGMPVALMPPGQPMAIVGGQPVLAGDPLMPARLLAAPVVSGSVIVPTLVGVGPVYRHRAYPNMVLFWQRSLNRWIYRSDSSAGWSLVSEEWNLAPPREPTRP